MSSVDLAGEPLAWVVGACGALLKLVDLARAKQRAAERAADKIYIDSALAQAASAARDVGAARLEASQGATELLKLVHALEIGKERLEARILVLEADQGHAADELARVRKSMVTLDLMNERSDAQDLMLSRIEKRVGGSGQMPRAVPRSDPPLPPMRPRAHSRRDG